MSFLIAVGVNDSSDKESTDIVGKNTIYIGENNDLPISIDYLGPKIQFRIERKWDSSESLRSYFSPPTIDNVKSHISSDTPTTCEDLKLDSSYIIFFTKASGVLSSDAEHRFSKVDSTSIKMNIRSKGRMGDIYKSGNVVNFRLFIL